jgi:L-fucose isomerase-like protein
MSAEIRIGIAGISFTPFWGFEESQYQSRVGRLGEVGKRVGVTVVALPETFQDAEGAARAAKKLNGEADLAILDVATYPEGKAAGVFFDTLELPLALWSRDESEYNTHIGHNSFCGANFLAGNLALRGQRFRSLYGELDAPEFLARLRTAVRLIGAAKRAAGSRIGLFGEGVVPKFYDIDIQPKDRRALEERFGIRFVSVPTEDVVKCFTTVEIPDEAISRQARLLRAIRDFCNEGKFASIAVRCWPELQALYNVWPCPVVSTLNEAGVPAACEGDPGGALDMLLASQLSDRPATLVDIVNWDDERNTFAIWHCGPTACSWADEGGARLIPHNVDGRTPGGTPALGLPGVVDMQFSSGPVTVFRTLGALDDEFAVEGSLIRTPGRRICGSFGTVSGPTIYGQEVESRLIRDGILNRALPHHYTAARGHLFL